MGFAFGRVFYLGITMVSGGGSGEKTSPKTDYLIVKSINPYVFFPFFGSLLKTGRV
jgi:hypothetical protein